MTAKELKDWVKIQITKHPKHEQEIIELYSLCIDEINDGGSPTNEIYLCKDSVEQLIEETNS